MQLSDPNVFGLVSGLWKGERAPMQRARILRSTNFRGDGLLDFADVAELEVESRHVAERSLAQGDIIIERSGGGPKQPVGRVALFVPPDSQTYFTSNFTTALRVVDRSRADPRFVALYLHALYLGHATETLQRATTGIRNLDWQEYLSFEIPEIPVQRQGAFVEIAEKVRASYLIEDDQVATFQDLKRATMHHLFTRGLRGEPQKETDIGLVPESWEVEPIANHHAVVSGGTPSRGNPGYWIGGTIPWVKTTEVNYCVISDTQERITAEGLENSAAKLLSAGTLLMAMYGQGVTRGKVAVLGIDAACNQACAAIRPTDHVIVTQYLYHFLTYRYDAIRQLAHGGQQQNLNLDIVRELPIAFPKDEAEQSEIASILDAIDRKIALHKQKRAVLEDLFKALLHKLMTGEIRVEELDLAALSSSQSNGTSQ